MKLEEALIIAEGNKLKRLENFHTKTGYIIVSASRADKSEVENNQSKNLLKKELGRTGFSFNPPNFDFTIPQESGFIRICVHPVRKT